MMTIDDTELKLLYTRLKNEEGSLSPQEKNLLRRFESALYSILSIEELEVLTSGKQGLSR